MAMPRSLRITSGAARTMVRPFLPAFAAPVQVTRLSRSWTGSAVRPPGPISGVKPRRSLPVLYCTNCCATGVSCHISL